MEIDKLLSGKEINASRSLERHFCLKTIKDIRTQNKLKQPIFYGLGRGKWNILAIVLKKEYIYIQSVCLEEIIQKLIGNLNIKGLAKIQLNSVIWSYKTLNQFKELLKKLKSFGIEITTDSDNEGSRIFLDFQKEIDIEKVSKMINLFLELHQKAAPYADETSFCLKSKQTSFHISLFCDSAIIKHTYKKQIIIKILNDIFGLKSQKQPYAYLFYADITDILGSWKGKRKGHLVQEIICWRRIDKKQYPFLI